MLGITIKSSIMKKIYLLISVCFLVTISLVAQEKTDVRASGMKTTDYNRNSITLMQVNGGNSSYDNILTELSKKWVPSDKFNFNKLSDPIFPCKFVSGGNTFRSDVKSKANNGMSIFKEPTATFYGSSRSSIHIEEELEKLRIPNEIISIWFNRQEDGSFNTETLQERGYQNASFTDLKEAEFSKRGMSMLGDQGEMLINDSYILAFAFSDVKPYDDAKYSQYGFTSNFECWLYKLDFNDSISATFFEQFWINPSDSESVIAEKKAAFDAYNFPLETVLKIEAAGIKTIYGYPSSGKSRVSSETQLKEIFNKSITLAITEIENSYEKFRIRTSITATRPIRARIGSKENLSSDKRFLVYEARMKNNMESWKLIGAIRSKKIADNKSSIGSEKSSTFYQMSGRDIDPGMMLSQKNEIGVSISGGYVMPLEESGIGGGELSLDYLISKGTQNMVGWKLGINVGFDAKDYSKYTAQADSVFLKVKDSTDSYTFTRFDISLSKSLFFARIFALTPKVGGGMEFASNSEYDKNFSTYYGKGALEFSIALTYYLRIYGMATYYLPIGTATYDKKNVHIQENALASAKKASWNELFEGRDGASLNFGIKIVF